jgi:rod shape-determining protein MreC
MVKRLYDILLLFKEYLVVALCLLASTALLTFSDTPQIRTLRAYSVVAVGLLQDAFSFLPNYFDLRRENEALRTMNLALADEVSRLREGRLENLRLRRLLDLKERREHRYIAANVVGRNVQLLRNTITLDVGADDSVAVNMPIVTEAGLVGKIIAVGSSYAIGQTLLHVELRVSAKVQRSRVDGIIRWDRARNLSLQNVARTYDVVPGDVVITSDYSPFFPEGIRIGTVAETRPIPGSLFQAVDVTPAVEFSSLEEVFVMRHTSDSARVLLEQTALATP